MSSHRILKIGRDPSNDFVLTHQSISRHHIEVFINEEGQVFVTDMRSSNGTFINGKRLSGSALLQPGDILKLGAERPIRWQEWTKPPAYTSLDESEEANSILDLSQTPPPGYFEKNRDSMVGVMLFLLAVAIIFYFYNQNKKGGKWGKGPVLSEKKMCMAMEKSAQGIEFNVYVINA